MTGKIKHLKIFLLVLLLNANSFASSYKNTDSSEKDDYEADYYTNEGSLVFKGKILGIKSDGKQKSLPQPTAANPVSAGNFVQNGYGVEASTSIFFSRYIAAELSLGFNLLRTKYSSLANVSHNYGVDSNLGKRKDLYMVPLTLTAQWHPFPFGGIDLYVGGGYSGAYLFSKAKGFNIKNSHGPVAQIGVDFYAKDDTLINLDIKQYFLEPKVTYKSSVVGDNRVSSKVKLNPLVFSAGIGFKF